MVAKGMVAVIPARGGSKRIPRKNVIDFCGKPIISWTIEAALETGRFDRVLVSTDDEEIASISREYGADVPFLRDSCNDDVSSSSEATLAALEQLERIKGERYGVVVQLMANCPMRRGEHIVAALDHFKGAGARFQISCSQYGWLNPWWAHFVDDHGRAKAAFPEQIGQRSQDLPTIYCPTGAIWIADVEALKKSGSFYGPDHRFFPLEWKAGVDIDDEEDLDIARAFFFLRKEKEAPRG